MGLCLSHCVFSQSKHDANWVFGDSVGLDFTNISPSLFASKGKFIEENANSISDEFGQLLFYLRNTDINNTHTLEIWNSDTLVKNGHMIATGHSWTQGSVFLPLPDCDSLYYLFHIQTSGFSRGFYHSIVNIDGDNGKGEVIIKNYKIMGGGEFDEQVEACKHSNGRDWWIIVHRSFSNLFYSFLFTNLGVKDTIIQNIGNANLCGVAAGQMKFSPNGSKFCSLGVGRGIDLFSFDRCTGIFNNWLNIISLPPCGAPIPEQLQIYGCSFSETSDFLYVSSGNWLYQFDLTASSISSSVQILFVDSNINRDMGKHVIAPDNKIYIANSGGLFSPVDSFSTHLSVINSPNNASSAVDFSPYFFSLNGHSSYAGLPSYPNYNLGPIPIYAIDTPQLTYTICKGDTIQIGLADTFPEIMYNWQAAHDTGWQSTLAQPIISHDTTTRYYLTRTDTAASYSCNVRFDTIMVYVEQPDTTLIDTVVIKGNDYLGVTITGNDTLFENLYAGNGCDSIVVHRIQVVTEIGQPQSLNNNLRIYPNPSTGEFIVDLADIKLHDLIIYDAFGEIVKIGYLVNTKAAKFNLSTFPNGLYLIKFTDSKNNLIKTEKILLLK